MFFTTCHPQAFLNIVLPNAMGFYYRKSHLPRVQLGFITNAVTWNRNLSNHLKSLPGSLPEWHWWAWRPACSSTLPQLFLPCSKRKEIRDGNSTLTYKLSQMAQSEKVNQKWALEHGCWGRRGAAHLFSQHETNIKLELLHDIICGFVSLQDSGIDMLDFIYISI